MISARDLSVTFRNGGRSIHAVRGVSFDVAEGETFGIVGESGSGKSTILRAIAGLVPFTAAALEVNGRPAANRRSRADRRVLQFVFQDPYASLHPRQTVDDGDGFAAAAFLVATGVLLLIAWHDRRVPSQTYIPQPIRTPLDLIAPLMG